VISLLLIEDNRTDVFLVKEALAAHAPNSQLEVLEDGEQAIRYIERIDRDITVVCPSLFLLDLNLPKTPGLEVLTRIRGCQRCATIPVLIMSSSDAERDRSDAAAAGATAYFRKPSGYEAFLTVGEVIRELLGDAKAAAMS
jgi:two-component system, chemotaxis family, response regulator Rcp1